MVQHLDDGEAQALIQRILDDFGGGHYTQEKYIFEQITTLPLDCTGVRMSAADAIDTISADTCIVILDPHRNNSAYAVEVRAALQANGIAFHVSTDRLPAVLAYDQCDLCVVKLDGSLLFVGCHEDDVVNGERFVWVPVRNGT